ncbi:MAG TPA: hypothetical protein VII42_02235, partial [Caulobacteraceae bacterium]
DATQATDAFNHASVTQGGGSGNQASITQSQGGFGAVSNPSNVSNSDQEGANGFVTVVQVGNDTSSISQLVNSSSEHAVVGQSNNGNSAAVQQGGQNEFALVNQEEGTGNSASIAQSGTGNGVDGPNAGHVFGVGDQYRNENLPNDSVLVAANGPTTYGPVGAYVDQIGSNQVGQINQQGFQNFADVSQGDPSAIGSGNMGYISQGAGVSESDAVIYQQGQQNIASINQSNGTSYSTVWQNGSSNQAYSTQVGSDSSVIAQGQVGAGNEPGTIPTPGPAVSGDYASVDQTTGGDNSLVNQTGNNDSAYVSQTSTANAMSTITQGGSFNVASVHQ